MPKVARTADSGMGEDSPAVKQARMSNSSSPVGPHFSIHLSPQPDSCEAPQEDSPYKAFPLLSPPENRQSNAASPGVLSPHLTICLNTKPENVGVSKDHPNFDEDDSSAAAHQMLSEKVASLSDEEETMDSRDKNLRNTHKNYSNSQLGKDVLEEGEEHKVEDCVDDSGGKGKDRQVASGDKADSLKETGCCGLRSDGMSQSEKGIEGSNPCSLTGYVTLAARNGGDSLLHGMLPPVFPPGHQGAPLNTCFPASDGNWYQILSASLPPILTSQPPPPPLTESKENKGQTTSSSGTTQNMKDNSSGTAATYHHHHPLSLLSGLSLPTSAAAAAAAAAAVLSTATSTSSSIVAPLSSPADPLLSLLQQYTTGATCSPDLQNSLSALHMTGTACSPDLQNSLSALHMTGTACSPDLQNSLSALHMPLNMASAAVAAAAAASGGAAATPSHLASPRYLYATNPRTGQLLILSSVGELAGTQPLSLQSAQLPLQPVLQLQQQQMKMQEKSWKSPLRLKHCQNSLITPTASGIAAGKQAPKPVSVVSKLLQSKFPCSLNASRKHDENLPSVAAARDLLALATPAHTPGTPHTGGVPSLLFNTAPDLKPSEEPVRENHNMKERRRRARIKDACDLMRQLVPGMSEKTDKATVFEFSARYIHFLKNFVGTHHDKDFLIKYSPY